MINPISSNKKNLRKLNFLRLQQKIRENKVPTTNLMSLKLFVQS